MNKYTDPKTSKCWTCKFGLCLREGAKHIVEHESMPDDDEDAAFPFSEGAVEIHEHIVAVTQVMALCTFLGEKMPPIKVGFVEECNRYSNG